MNIFIYPSTLYGQNSIYVAKLDKIPSTLHERISSFLPPDDKITFAQTSRSIMVAVRFGDKKTARILSNCDMKTARILSPINPHTILVPSISKNGLIPEMLNSEFFCNAHGNQFIVGKKYECGLQIDYKKISRRHCIIERERKSLYITDVSRNGIHVSTSDTTPQRLNKNEKYKLKNGSIIDFWNIDKIRYYVFDIDGIEPNENKCADYSDFDVEIEKDNTKYNLTINNTEQAFDLSVYNSKNLAAIIYQSCSLSSDVCTLIVEYFFYDLMHHISYIIGSKRPNKIKCTSPILCIWDQ